MKRLALILALLLTVCPWASAQTAPRPQVPVSRSSAAAPQAFDARLASVYLSLREFDSAGDAARTSDSTFADGDAETWLSVSTFEAGSSDAWPPDSAFADWAADIWLSGSPFEAGASAASAGVSEAASSDAARAAVSATAFRDSVSSAYARASDFRPEPVSDGEFVHMVLCSEDDAALWGLLAGLGVTLREPGNARELPEFTTAVECASDEYLAAPLPAGLVRAVEWLGEADASIAYVGAHPGESFVVIIDIDHLGPVALKGLAGRNIAAIVVGHTYAYDERPGDFAPHAEDVERVVTVLRRVSDAPVLLALSTTNAFTGKTEKGWADAFGDGLAAFDGVAIYNLHQFPAILEATGNPRTAMLERYGLPDKPCFLLDFVGGAVETTPERLPRLKASWDSKAGPLVKALKAQGWRGVVVWGSTSADVAVKASALAGR